MIKVSAVILSYNRKDDLRKGIEKILSYKLPYVEIIVVDNASTDGTVEMIEKEFKEVKLIKLKDNIGVAGYNVGFESAKGDYILILDDDSYPAEGTIEKMVETFERDEKLGIIALDVRSENQNKLIDEKRGNLKNSEGEIKYLMGFNGAGAGFRKSVFKIVGGYPEEFFLYWNEADLSIRLLNEGYKILWLPGAIVYHRFSPKNRDSQRGPFFYTRNLYWLIIKYFPAFKMMSYIVKMLYLSFYFSMEQRTFVYLKASLNALFYALKPLKKRIKVRKEIIDNLKITYSLAFTIFR